MQSEESIIEEEEMEQDASEEDEETVLARHLSQGLVPDATMIHAVRKKREMARKLGVESVDYLPLKLGGKRT